MTDIKNSLCMFVAEVQTEIVSAGRPKWWDWRMNKRERRMREKVTESMVFQATILHCTTILGLEQHGLVRWILLRLRIMPQVEDRSLDLLTCSITCALLLFHGPIAPEFRLKEVSKSSAWKTPEKYPNFPRLYLLPTDHLAVHLKMIDWILYARKINAGRPVCQ